MKTRTKLLSAAVVGLTLLGGIYIAHSQDMGPPFGLCAEWRA